MKFDLPPIHYLPARLTVKCEVKKAYPNFQADSEVIAGPLYGEKFLRTAFTGVITESMEFSQGKQQTQAFECTVVWLRETNNETLGLRRIVSFHCEYVNE